MVLQEFDLEMVSIANIDNVSARSTAKVKVPFLVNFTPLEPGEELILGMPDKEKVEYKKGTVPDWKKQAIEEQKKSRKRKLDDAVN